MKLLSKIVVLTAFFIISTTIACQELDLTPPLAPVMEQPEIPATSSEQVSAIPTKTEEIAIEQAVSPAQDEDISLADSIIQLNQSIEPLIHDETQLLNEFPINGVNIGLSSEIRQKIATILNKLLSDEYVLYTKTLKFHWNVTGIVFHDFHAAFKEQYEKLFTIVDDIAERARALGAPAFGSLQEFSTYTRLKEITTKKLSALDMVKQLLADHEEIIRTLRAAIDETAALGDQGTSNFLQDLIVKHEKIAWMLRATAAQ